MRKLSNILLWGLGIIFIISAILKAIGVYSFSQTVNSFCSLLGMDFLYGYGISVAIAIIVCELLIGLCSIARPCQRIVVWIYPIILGFFTYITYINYTDLYGGIESCGCFGELIHFTPATSFYKNIALFALSLVLLIIRLIETYSIRKLRYGLFLVSILLLNSCQNQLDNALELAGDNRHELEIVLNHYKDDPDTLKYGAAKFLIENMPYHYSYQDEDMLHYDSAFVSMAQEQEQFRDSVFKQRLGESVSFRPYPDIKSIKSDFLIRMIDEACEAWHAASWSKDYDISYFYEYVLPYRLLNEPLSFWRDSLAADYAYLRQPGIRSFRGYKIEAEQAGVTSCEHMLSEFASNKEALVFRQEGDSVSFQITSYRPVQKVVYLCYSTDTKCSSAVISFDGHPLDTIHFLPTQSITTFKPMRMYYPINVLKGEHFLTIRYLSGKFGIDYIHSASFFPLEKEELTDYSGVYCRIKNKQTGNYITFDTLQTSLLSPVEVKPLIKGDSCSFIRLDYVGYASWRIAAFKRDSIDLCCDVLGESTSIDTPIIQWKYTNFNNQKWVLQPEGNGWCRIMSKDSGQYLEARTDKTTGLITMVTHPYTPTNAQLWKIEQFGAIPERYTQPTILEIGSSISAAYRIYELSGLFEWCDFSGNIPPKATSLLHWRTGNCREESNFAVYFARYMGIPATTDYTPQWANRSQGHSWTMIINPSGKGTAFYMGAAPGDTTSTLHKFRKSKILRHKFSPNLTMVKDFRNETERPPVFNTLNFIDVTEEYMETTDVIRDVPHEYADCHLAYICTFDNKDWVPIYYGTISGGKVKFSKMGRKIAYIMAFYKNQKIIPVGNPFIITEDGNIEDIEINSSKQTTLELTRKYPFMGKEDFFNFRMSGGRFQGSNRADFKDATDIYIFEGMTEGNWYELFINESHTFRYLRYAGPNGSFCNINELEFYDIEGREIKGEIIGSKAQLNGSIENVFDKNILTGFNAVSPDGSWVGLKLSAPTRVSKIRFIGRNDGNCIEVGDEYELVYWNGSKWKELGRKKAKSNRLVYKNVPANALYILHNLTKGKEERIFTYKKGGQIWW
ncbi:MAG: hypothetical protein E7102_03190 [Prevotella ruminicola]|uniref:Ricin B lectin domain-containing protein n=1 Tax=Xylanibacter ruminicola TaxID=839 RepID=A0A928BS01_XYLRU|nr:hypothetical protein [Xylanibacter ruminicola]